MCGIAGYFTTAERDSAILRRMTNAIRHRGPDSEGQWQDDEAGIALGMRRLAIIDLSPAGRQPMVSADGRYVIVFNGEIYNFHQIRIDLERGGWAQGWRGHSDTEVLLSAISAWGVTAAIKACNGMFGLAVWDREVRSLHIAVDRFGEKPLYYGWMKNSFLFGSELKALMVHPAWDGKIDRQALALFMRFAYVPAPHSIFQGIRKLEPGTIATLRLDSVHDGRYEIATETYWSARETIARAKTSPLFLSENDAIGEFEKLLAEAVKLRMVSDVPLGAFLSGGFDSSAIVALMQKQSPRPVKTFSIGFTERSYNEAPFAKAVAKHLGTEHTELYVSPRQAMDVIPNLPAIYDEPFADSSQIPTFLVSQMARQHVTVALSGDAGDELLGGYARYFISNRTLPVITRLPMSVRRAVARGIEGMGVEGWDRIYRTLTLGRGKGHVGDRALKFANLLALPSLLEGYRSFMSNWQSPVELLPDVIEPLTPLDYAEAAPPGLCFIERMMFLDTVTYLPGDILTKVDRASMAVSLEARVPFLDPAILDFAWRLPLEYKIRKGVGKWILREMVYRHIPRQMMDRPKTGFGIPLKDWLRGPLRGWAEGLLTPTALADSGIAHKPVRLLWCQHQSGRRNWQQMLWPILMFLAWKRHFME